MNKREFLKAGFLGLVGLSVLKTKANNTSGLSNGNLYETPKIPYREGIHRVFSESSYNILFKNHIENAVKNLNTEVQTLAIPPRSVRSIIVRESNTNLPIKQNACDFYNHKLFFKLLSKESSNQNNTDRFMRELEDNFMSLSSFQNSLEETALDLKDDGWLWVINTRKGLIITTIPDRQSPLSKNMNEFPVLGIDLCSNTYYSDYQHNKTRYVRNVIENINWAYVNKRYTSSINYLRG